MPLFPTSLDGEYAGGSVREPVCTCWFCRELVREDDAYDCHGLTACPSCNRVMPEAILSIDERNRTASIDAWHSDKQAANHFCEDHGIKMTHTINAAKAAEMLAEVEHPKTLGSELWDLFAKR